MAKKIKLSYTASVAFAVSVVSAVFLTATYSANPASSAPFTRLDRGFHGRSDAHVFVFGPFKETGQLFLTPKNVTTHTALSYPFEKAGDAATFSDFSVLVAGRDDAQDRGVIVRYTKNAQDVMVLADTYTFTGGDVIGLVHDDINNKLYMLDLGHREIRSAPYTMGSTIPTSWTTVATATNVPFLASSGLCECSLFRDPATPNKLLIGDYRNLFSKDFAWVDVTVPTQTTVLGTDAWPSLDRGLGFLVGATTVTFEAPNGTQVDIVRVLNEDSWVVIGSGTAGVNGTGSATVQALQFGDIIEAKASNLALPTPPVLTPVLRTGVPDRLDPKPA